jgi:hypothetical protein
MSGLQNPWLPLIGKTNYYKTSAVEEQYHTNDLVWL